MLAGFDAAVFDDETLIQRILTGEKTLYRILVERYKKQVNALGISFLRNEIESEDFSQDVFVKAFKNLERFEMRSRFSTWLYRIAYNTAINNVQRRTEFVSLAENETLVAADRTPEDESIRAAVRKAVRLAIDGLPEKYRICIDLFFFYDCSYDEISSITGDPVNTIKSHVFRAKKILREKLREVR